ncbi:hypothetical protein G7Y89_g12006 [Cudoniella acicularis]|uniref:RRM domain-containing protein n=1 Tax=Cudoniella acicularis TaxID=354080 RepID=A0A8H4RC79_9HELO|nr:hypothetical protein G7Y89_g12006 [Cudoniella acicularis]
MRLYSEHSKDFPPSPVTQQPNYVDFLAFAKQNPAETSTTSACVNVNIICVRDADWAHVILRQKSYDAAEQVQESHGASEKLPRFQLSVFAKSPSPEAQSFVLQYLRERFILSFHKPELPSQKDQALVILATPEFATWLEDIEFLKDVLQAIAKPSRKRDESSLHLDFSIVCACVDGLANSIGYSSTKKVQQMPLPPGLSFLQGSLHDILPGLWENEDHAGHNEDLLSSLTFSGSDAKWDTDLTLPLANTLFTNGRKSTLIISKWQLSRGSFKKVKSFEKKNQTINVFNGMKSLEPSIPVLPLTPPRTIASGLGNIVRTLQFGQEDIGPASRELEECVDEYLKLSKDANQSSPKFSVWALIIPDHIMRPLEELQGFRIDLTPKQISSYRQGKQYVGFWISKGAIFARVVSGGGGWGLKQGLLSLDPETSYSNIDDILPDSSMSFQEQQSSALGNIAQSATFAGGFGEGARLQDSTDLLNIKILPPPLPNFRPDSGSHSPHNICNNARWIAHSTRLCQNVTGVDALEDAVLVAEMTVMITLATATSDLIAVDFTALDAFKGGPGKYSTREDSRNIDSEWVHDKFDDNSGRRPIRAERRYSPERSYESSSAKLRVENLHYDLTEEDLDDLFNRIGPVLKLALVYDRAGRSEGIAYVTYESSHDAKRAIREFDGANAKGQPIRLISIPTGPAAGRRNPFDSAIVPGRSLADRITLPPGRSSRSESPIRHSDVSGPPPSNVDRYVPGRGSRSRSPRPRPRDGRRPGARRERGDRRGGRGGGGERLARDGRPKKTQEELDAEMEDYWGSKANGTEAAAEPAPAPAPVTDDVDMIE